VHIASQQDEEEQEENIENNGEVNKMPALHRKARVSQLVCQWWMVDTRNPVNYVFNVNDTPEDELLRKAARDSEYCTLMEYNTWDLVPAPPNRKIVGSKWVDTIKRDGTFKSRLVCQSFSQVEGDRG
jgi:hypothetical protein